MRHERLAASAADDQSENVTAGPFTTPCDRLALRRLEEAYTDIQALAVLTGSGRRGVKQIVDTFIGSLEDDTEVVRIEEPFVDALHCMRFIIQSIDFDPKDLNINDLDNIFTMFLSFQHTHNRRTVVCIENAQDFDWWTLDKLRGHIGREARHKYGLMVVLCGSPDLNELMHKPPLDSVAALAAEPISLADCSLAETREYIRRQVESGTGVFIGDLFEYESATLIHELSGGVTDTIDDLCRKSLGYASQDGSKPVTEDIVMKAGMELGLVPEEPPVDTQKMDMRNTFAAMRARRLIARMNGHVIKELDLDQGHLLIGRDDSCEIRVSGRQVDRHHALIINTASGVKVADLGTLAGTAVNGCNVAQQELTNADIIEIGEYRIEFVEADNELDEFSAREPAEPAAPAHNFTRMQR